MIASAKRAFRTACFGCLIAVHTLSALAQTAPEDPAPAPPFDLARLAHPEIAEALNLTTQQRAQVAELVDARAKALAAAEEGQREEMEAESDRQLTAVLTGEQQTQLSTLSSARKLRFNFREQPWVDVLDWFAKQAELSLVVNTPPGDTFTYRDTKEYTPAEAIDLLNGVLMTKGFTLVRRERMLICLDTSGGVPAELIPKVQLEELDRYGNFELVTVVYPLGARPAQVVSDEIQPLIGTYGSSIVLPQTKQIIVTETAGKMRAISAVIGSIPEPKPAAPAAPKPPAPKPVLASYPYEALDPAAAVESIKQLIEGATFTIDRTSGQVSVYATPDQQAAAKAAIAQLVASATSDARPRVQSYRLRRGGDPTQLEERLKLMISDIQVIVDVEKQRLAVFGSPTAHAQVADVLKNLGIAAPDGVAPGAFTYQVKNVDASWVATVMQDLAPDALVVADTTTGRIVVRASAEDEQAIRKLLEQIDAAPQDEPALALEFYNAPLDEGGDLTETLKTVAPKATITWDAARGRFRVLATAVDHARLAIVIQQLNTREAAKEKSQLAIYTLTPEERKTLDAIMPSLTAEMPGVKIVTGADPRELPVWATSSQHEVIRQFLEQLKSVKPEKQARRFESYPVHGLPLAEAQTTLQGLVPEARSSADTAGGRVIVWGTDEDHQQVRAALEALTAPQNGDLELAAYPISEADPASLLEVLMELYQDTKIVLDEKTGRLLVWAEDGQQQRIKRAIEQLDAPPVPGMVQKLISYPTGNVAPDQLLPLLQQLAPDMTLAVAAEAGAILAWGAEMDHQRLAETIDGLRQRGPGEDRQLIVYRLKSADPEAARQVLSVLLPSASLAVDPSTRSLVATALPEDHEKIKTTLDQLDIPSDEDLETKVYAVREGDPEVARAALARLLPDTTLTADPTTGILVATASAADHEKITRTLEQMDRPSDDRAVLKPYVIKNGDPNEAYSVLGSLFAGQPSVGLTLDATGRTILALADARQHATIAEVIAQLEQTGGPRQGATLQTFSLGHADGATLTPVLESLFKGQTPKVEFSVDTNNRRLIAVALPSQHEMIRTALAGMRGEDRVLEVFQLELVDPRSAAIAIENLFIDATLSDSPTVDADADSQQLFVRATAAQVKKIRDLLTKMGEMNLQGGAAGNARTIPFNGDLESALREIGQIWPQLRRNPIQVVPSRGPRRTQSAPESNTDSVPALPPNATDQQPHDGDSAGADACDLPVAETEAGVAEVARHWPIDPISGEIGYGRIPTAARLTAFRQVSFQPGNAAEDGAAPNGAPAIGSGDAAPAQPPPIIVIPGEGRVTVFSEDVEALRQFEALLRTLARRDGDAASVGNFLVVPLRNAGANAVASLLDGLFRRLSTSGLDGVGRVAIVADERLNSVVIHGSRAERKTVETLIRLLDTSNVPESLGTRRAEIVPLANAQATRVLAVLQTLYQPQLTAGGSRRQVSIPEGVSGPVAEVLQQINAATAGPLLTLDVDKLTNSIIIMAPTQLGEEVAELVRRLDTSALENSARQISIIPLKKVNAQRMSAAIDVLLKGRSD